MFVPNLEILGAVVPEKSLTQISLCITLEWGMEKRKKVKRSQKKFQPLRKHAYSNIVKILPPKNETFQIKNSDIFHISAQNIDCGYSLELPCRGGSNEYPQSMFLSRNKKNNVYPCKPQFYYIKVGFKGVKIIYACFRDAWDFLLHKILLVGVYKIWRLILFGAEKSAMKNFIGEKEKMTREW